MLVTFPPTAGRRRHAGIAEGPAVRSVGCGLLLLALGVAPAVGQAPAPEPRPSLEEARADTGCDATPWAGSITDIKAADPERDAENLIGKGDFPLIRAKPPVRVARLAEWRLPQAPDAGTSDPASKLPPENAKSKIIKFTAEIELADV